MTGVGGSIILHISVPVELLRAVDSTEHVVGFTVAPYKFQETNQREFQKTAQNSMRRVHIKLHKTTVQQLCLSSIHTQLYSRLAGHEQSEMCCLFLPGPSHICISNLLHAALWSTLSNYCPNLSLTFEISVIFTGRTILD